MKKFWVIAGLCLALACKKDADTADIKDINVIEDPASYQEIRTINLGGLGAAEITAYDPVTKRLFAVNNGTENKIDVIDMSNPAAATRILTIPVSTYGGYVNSVDVMDGKFDYESGGNPDSYLYLMINFRHRNH